MEQINNAIKQLGNNFIDILMREYPKMATREELEMHFQTAMGVKQNITATVNKVEVAVEPTVNKVEPVVNQTKRSRGRTPYMCFAPKQRVIEKAKRPGTTGAAITAAVKAAWNALSADEKAIYEAESKAEIAECKKDTPTKNAAPKKKRAPNAYVVWQTHVRTEYKEKHPDLSFGDLTKILSDDWKKMSDVDKKPWLDKVEKMKADLNSSSSDDETVAHDRSPEISGDDEPLTPKVEEKVEETVEDGGEEESKGEEETPEIVSSTYGQAADSFLRRLVDLRCLKGVDTNNRVDMIKALEADDAAEDSDLSDED